MEDVRTQVSTNKYNFNNKMKIIHQITMKNLTHLLKEIVPSEFVYEIAPSYTRLVNILNKIDLFQKNTSNSICNYWIEWDNEMAKFQLGLQIIRDDHLKGKKLKKEWDPFQSTLSRLHKQITSIEKLQPSTCINVLLKSRILKEEKWVQNH